MGDVDVEVEVVVVSGGIAGAALATALARGGKEVLVLEASERFVDRVRGESMQPWGVREAEHLGVADALRAAGAHTAPVWKRYAEGSDEPRDIPVGLLVPGVEGTLNLRHPVACQTLVDAAAASGAQVQRGVADVRVDSGAAPSVSYTLHGEPRSVTASLVVGADGRASVVRRDAGIVLEKQAALGFIAGLQLEDLALPDDHDLIAEHDHGLFLLFHQGNGEARAYHVVPERERTRYAGRHGTERFLADAVAMEIPHADKLGHATPAGPCAAFPGTDTWTPQPYAPGIVLIGDAAGHNDPTAGCGLSIAMRDARMVAELFLGGAREPQDFEPYGAERAERLRRLRLIADLVSVASVEEADNRRQRRKHFAEAMAAMDPQIFPLMLGMFAGPEVVPPHLVDTSVLDRIRAA